MEVVGMYIHEATKKALEIDGFIAYGYEQGTFGGIYIKPTNTIDGCIGYQTVKRTWRGWQPIADHLISDRWQVVSQAEFAAVSQRRINSEPTAHRFQDAVFRFIVKAMTRRTAQQNQ